MNKEMFLYELDRRISYIDIDERCKIINFYSEIIQDKIDDGLSEVEAVESLGSINDIVNEISKDEYSFQTFIDKYITPLKNIFKTDFEEENVQNCFEFKYMDNLSINVSSEKLNIILEKSNNDNIKVEVDNSDASVYCQANCIYIKDENDSFFGFGNKNYVKILIPGKKINNINLSNESGNVEIYDVSANIISLKLDHGNICMYNGVCNEITLETEAGEIIMNNCKVDNGIFIETECGNISLSDVSSLSLNTKTEAGNIQLMNVYSKDVISKTELGNINALISDNESNYYIDIDVEVGKINSPLGNTNGINKIYFSTELGNVNLNFKN